MNKIFLKSIVMCFIALSPTYAFAVHLDCGTRLLSQVMVQGSRDDGHPHDNTLTIKLNDSSCNGRPYLYLKNTHPAYNSMLAIALAAKGQVHQSV